MPIFSTPTHIDSDVNNLLLAINKIFILLKTDLSD